MPDHNEPFDAALQKLSRAVDEGARKAHPATPADLQAVQEAVRRQFAERASPTLTTSVIALHQTLDPLLRSTLAEVLRVTAFAHPSPDALTLLTWNIVAAACVSTTPESTLPESRRLLRERGRLVKDDLSDVRDEFNQHLVMSRRPDSATLSVGVRSVLESSGIERVVAERAASEIVAAIVRQVENA